uniref:protein-tyrosine-phosphatase n=1 Tax=Denticeps clupeoides TaxID=299321 RepID=A0AAY4B0J7_9TELE
MPFRIKLRRTRRYVLSKNYFVTRIRLLDTNVIECTLSVESTGQECLEAVAQRLELRETHYFGLWFHTKAQVHRWVELEKPIKKQLDKFGIEPLLFFGVMFYVPSVSRLEDEATRYQYYLQVKKEVLDGHLHCTVEQGIRLAGLAVQADFGDFSQYKSQDFLRKYVLFPVNWPQVDEFLEEWTQKVAEEHKSHCRMLPAEAELLYIKDVEKLDGFGQESFAAKDNYTNDIFIGVSFIGVFVKHRNGRSIMLHRWKDIGTIAHNKSAITVEITSKDDTIMFHTEDMEMAKYIAQHFTARHKFYKQNKICCYIISPNIFLIICFQKKVSLNFTDSIFHDDPYYKSETSLDHCHLEFGFRNGTVPNGSMCSSPSVNSLNRSQTFMQASPVSSNLSIPGSELMRPDYIPSHLCY